MKRVLSILIVAMLVFGIVGCTPAEKPETPAEPSAPTEPEGWVPTKNIECVIPFAPGGGSDVLTRAMMEYLELPEGIKIVPTYVDGGAGALGAQQAAAAAPDGYTILAHNPSNVVGQGVTGVNNLWKELILLGGVVDDWTVVCTNKATGWTSVEEMVEYVKEHPKEIKWGLTGTGTGMATVQRASKLLGIDATVVPYDGGADSRAALLGNHIQLETTQSSDARAYVQSGDVFPLFVIAKDRCPLFPDTPTLLELGHELVLGAPRGYYAPAGTPDEVVAYYEDLLDKVCQVQGFIDACEELGYVTHFMGVKDGAEWQSDYYETQMLLMEELE